MYTIMSTIRIVRARVDCRLRPATSYIIQPYTLGTGPICESSSQSCSTSSAEPKLPAGHLSTRSAKEVIAYCSPFIVIADLQTSHVVSSTSLKSESKLCAHCIDKKSKITTVVFCMYRIKLNSSCHQSALYICLYTWL